MFLFGFWHVRVSEFWKVKSEFMVALDTAEKQVHEYQTKIGALEEQLSKSGMLWFTVILSFFVFLCILCEHG